MSKALVGALALLVAGSFSAFANPPADQEACNKTAFSLAELAAGKKLKEADAIRIDELVSKLEGQCAEGKLAEAGATAKEIEAALGK